MNWLASTFCSRKRKREDDEIDTEKLPVEVELGKEDGELMTKVENPSKKIKTAFHLPENADEDLEPDTKVEKTGDVENNDTEMTTEAKAEAEENGEKVTAETEDTFILADLKVGDKVDTQDKVGHYIPAEISEINEETGDYKIHYVDYDTKYDDTININTDGHRIVKLHSISLQKVKPEFKDLKKNSKIDVCVDGKWYIGTVLRFDVDNKNKDKNNDEDETSNDSTDDTTTSDDTDESDDEIQLCQAQVKYKTSKTSKAKVYWFNTNDENLVAPIGTHTE